MPQGGTSRSQFLPHVRNCKLSCNSEISGEREVETRESEVKKEEEGGENHLVVSCTNSSYFTPVERPVKEKQAEERYFRRIF